MATSFTFSPVLFEEECLSRFLQLESDAAEDGPAYLVEREEKLSQLMCAAALVDQHHACGVRSLRWDLLPARLAPGILHAKIALLLWSRRARLIVTSANLSQDGYRRNHEVFGALDYFDGSTMPLTALDDNLEFLREAARTAVVSDGRINPAVNRWEAFLNRVAKDTRTWGASELPRLLTNPRVSVVVTGPARESVFSSLRKQWPGGGPPDLAVVVSPFFDPPASANTPAREMWALLRQCGDATVEFNLTAEDVPGERAILLHAPESLLTAKPANRGGTETVIRRLNLEEGRLLHAKSLWLENDSVAMLMMGSSNFTSAGLGLGKTKNLEANLAYAVSRQNGDAMRALQAARLPVAEVPDGVELRWQPRIDEGEDSAPASFVILPTAFGDANFGGDEMQRGFVEFTFSGEPPAGWMLCVEDEREAFLTEDDWLAEGAPAFLRVTWDCERAPSGFRVSWTGSDGSAWWPVNVLSAAALPPPAELKDLPLEVLIEILTSANPLHQALQRWLRRQQDRKQDEARELLTEELKEVWRQCLNQLDFKLPLLVMDEAHHLKNPGARLSGLFQNPEALHDAEEISRGVLGGIFERMLFLTATPFQLGHHELCSVLERFEGIALDATVAPHCGREAFRQQLRIVRERLDAAHASALNLDAAWGLLRAEDLVADGRAFGVDEVECWWAAVSSDTSRTPTAEHVLAACHCTSERMRAAESALRPWVIRHLKERTFNGIPCRERLPGQAIHSDNANGDERGINVGGEALLPFLLAARATACMPEARPVFAEGLASSYEAFLHTRKAGAESLDGDDDDKPTAESEDEVANWYLKRLEEALPLNDHHRSSGHPKIAATARRVLELWRRGEKVVVFCHYVQTGRVLRQVISGLMTEEIYRAGAEKLGCASDEVEAELERLGLRFFDADSPARRACDAQVAAALSCYPQLAPHTAELQEVTRRYLRTPSFLVRFFPLSEGRLNEDSVNQAFTSGDASGLSLHDVLEGFFAFLAERCVEDERAQYLAAIRSVQTGTITGLDAQDAFAADERQGAAPERLLANVRLVNGAVKSETRQRLMLTFNSPFFPEVLIASSVMAEGVDLHRFCRHVIHHDLCWNPSTLEQRTGRVDRIGAKVERCGQPIRVYLPYLAETQDEKQYRVVMDRERWFSVIMGEKFDVDARSTEKLARRVPLPAALARELTLRLEIAQIKAERDIA